MVCNNNNNNNNNVGAYIALFIQSALQWLLSQVAALFTQIRFSNQLSRVSATSFHSDSFKFPYLVPISTPGWRETRRVKCFVQKHKCSGPAGVWSIDLQIGLRGARSTTEPQHSLVLVIEDNGGIHHSQYLSTALLGIALNMHPWTHCLYFTHRMQRLLHYSKVWNSMCGEP